MDFPQLASTAQQDFLWLCSPVLLTGVGGAKPWGKTEGDLPADLTQMVQCWPSLHKTQHQIFI